MAALLLFSGLALAGMSDEDVARAPLVAGGYTVLAGDFHVHSFPGDGSLAPWALAHEARRRRLDVIALTNHNNQVSWRLSTALGLDRGDSGVLVLPGDEVTAVGFHIAAIGVRDTVNWRGSPSEVAAEIHRLGGVAIAAHPAGIYRTAWDARALEAVDGVEAAHPEMFVSARSRGELAEVYARAVRLRPGMAAIGSTDFHTFAPLGLCRTYLFVGERTEAGVLDAIRHGRTVACDGTGASYGPARLVSFVAEQCRLDATAVPSAHPRLAALATAAAWLALFVLNLLGGREGE
jgi:hypothetical protein